MNKPNIIMIMTDQQRFDTIAALGFEHMKTPNLDKLASEGIVFNNCFCTAPSCVPSRASFFNCKFPGRQGVYCNADHWNTSWVELLRDDGYQCINVGKMHVNPVDDNCGFHQRYIVENKDRPGLGGDNGRMLDEWEKFLLFNGETKPNRNDYKAHHPLYETALGAYEWSLEEKYHPDVFVGNMARKLINQRESKKPLFLQIGFPGPHPPYDPPKRYIDMYEDKDFYLEPISDEEMASQPPSQAIYRQGMIECNHDAVRWHLHPTAEQLTRLRKFYAANVTLIDEQIGMIFDTLREKGLLDNSIVLFTSDHGDCLGDHNLIQKWSMYDSVTRIPAILWASENIPLARNKKTDALLEQFDLAHTILNIAGIDTPRDYQSISFADSLADGDIKGREYLFAEHSKDNVYKGSEFMTMIRSRKYKLVHNLGETFGELYDLEKDPGEHKNLWDCKEYADIKDSLLKELLEFKTSEHFSMYKNR